MLVACYWYHSAMALFVGAFVSSPSVRVYVCVHVFYLVDYVDVVNEWYVATR